MQECSEQMSQEEQKVEQPECPHFGVRMFRCRYCYEEDQTESNECAYFGDTNTRCRECSMEGQNKGGNWREKRES